MTEEYTVFDGDVIMSINTSLSILTQLGVGPPNGYRIEDQYDTWDEFLQDNAQLEMAKTYVHLKAKLIFDPPASSVILECINQMLKELEWRLVEAAEASKSTEEVIE